MEKQTITVHVKMDAPTFRRFAVFDTLRLRKRWQRPALFCAILMVFAVICFIVQKEQSVLIGCVLALVGLGFPLVYFGTFFSQVGAQIEAQKLDKPRAVYTLRFDSEGVHITNDRKAEPRVDLLWENAYAAFRVKGCIYLYATPAKAFLLPDGQADATPDELWMLLGKHMRRCMDRR